MKKIVRNLGGNIGGVGESRSPVWGLAKRSENLKSRNEKSTFSLAPVSYMTFRYDEPSVEHMILMFCSYKEFLRVLSDVAVPNLKLSPSFQNASVIP